MEYRDFRYSNDLREVELEQGSLIGVALSRLIIKTLQIVMIVVFFGIAHCGVMYFIRSGDAPKIVTAMSPEAVAASPQPAIDYHQHPLQPGLTASPAAVSGALVSAAARDPHAKLFERLVRHPLAFVARPLAAKAAPAPK
jgi:hypothetical protein